MLYNKTIITSFLSALTIILLQDLLVFSTITEQTSRIFFIKIFLEILLFIIYFATIYVFLRSKLDLIKENKKYNQLSGRMSFFTFLFFFCMPSAIFSEQNIVIRVIFFLLGVISLIFNIYYSWKSENEKLQILIDKKEDK